MPVFISSGPWIISILSIVILSVLLRPLLNEYDLNFFSASITHVYAFSLILAGPLQLVLTRFVADQFSAKTRERVFPSFLSALAITAVVSGAVASVFFLGMVEGGIVRKIAATSLMIYVSCIFIATNYLTALRGYKRVRSVVCRRLSCQLPACDHWCEAVRARCRLARLCLRSRGALRHARSGTAPRIRNGRLHTVGRAWLL